MPGFLFSDPLDVAKISELCVASQMAFAAKLLDGYDPLAKKTSSSIEATQAIGSFFRGLRCVSARRRILSWRC